MSTFEENLKNIEFVRMRIETRKQVKDNNRPRMYCDGRNIHPFQS